jgi:hypothetical protein
VFLNECDWEFSSPNPDVQAWHELYEISMRITFKEYLSYERGGFRSDMSHHRRQMYIKGFFSYCLQSILFIFEIRDML